MAASIPEESATDSPQGSQYPHLDPSILVLADGPNEDRAKRILSDITVYHPNFVGLLNEAEWMVREPRRSRARGIFVSANPGMGKTLLAKELSRMFPLLNRSIDGEQQPAKCAVQISMSGARQTKAILNRILEATGAPITRSVTVGDQEIAVAAHLRRLNCGLLVLDEMQDLGGARAGEQVRVLEVIKYLMNELSLPVVALGTESATTPFKSDPHLAARFEVHALPTWKVGDDLADFLNAYERFLPLKKASDLSKDSMQELLVKKSAGTTDGVLRCIRRAALWAIVEGGEKITMELVKRSTFMPDVADLLGSKCNAA
jgi:hypothetical protein